MRCVRQINIVTINNLISPLSFIAVQKLPAATGRVQCVLDLPEPRARVRLPEEPRDRGEDQQDPMAQEKEPRAFPLIH